MMKKKKNVPWPSGVFGCHLCCATRATGAFISTITTKSEDAFIAVAGRFQRSGLGTAYGLTFFVVWIPKDGPQMAQKTLHLNQIMNEFLPCPNSRV